MSTVVFDERLKAAGWPGLESLRTKPRGFAKRSNPGHPTVELVRVLFHESATI